jgi:hypothetical protein
VYDPPTGGSDECHKVKDVRDYGSGFLQCYLALMATVVQTVGLEVETLGLVGALHVVKDLKKREVGPFEIGIFSRRKNPLVSLYVYLARKLF